MNVYLPGVRFTEPTENGQRVHFLMISMVPPSRVAFFTDVREFLQTGQVSGSSPSASC